MDRTLLDKANVARLDGDHALADILLERFKSGTDQRYMTHLCHDPACASCGVAASNARQNLRQQAYEAKRA